MGDSHPCRPPRRKRVKDGVPSVVVKWAEKNLGDTDSGEVYVYLSPDAPILPIWRKVDAFSKPEVHHSHKNGLGAIPTAKMNRSETESLKVILKVLVHHGVAEVLDPPNSVSAASPEGKESWYRDIQTEAVFRLIEDPRDESSRWERVPPNQKEMATQ